MSPRPFTGRRMLATMLGFFGAVIAVNITMAFYAISTFGGTVVDNSYVASQHFNGWLAAARRQQTLGWSMKVDLDPGRRVRIIARVPDGALLTGTAIHPLGAVPDQPLAFVALGNGQWRSAAPLPAGRFRVRIDVRAAGHGAAFEDEVPA